MDWELHEPSFMYKGKMETLYGNPTLHDRKFSFKSLQPEKSLFPKVPPKEGEVIPAVLQDVGEV